jgi:LAS superfamily LD-carboxypeptidase LdcB
MRVLVLLCALVSLAQADARRVTGYVYGRRIPLSVVEIGWAEVEVKTAAAFLEMQQAASDEGVSLTIYSGFRTHESQIALYQRWREGRGNLAARPGHSRHQSGQALDLALDEATYLWLTKRAREFGFRRTVASEPWHWEFFGKPRVRRGASRTARPTPRAS